MQLLLKRAVAHLLQDICVPSLIDFECFATVRANDFMHVGASNFCKLWANRATAFGKSSLAPIFRMNMMHPATFVAFKR